MWRSLKRSFRDKEFSREKKNPEPCCVARTNNGFVLSFPITCVFLSTALFSAWGNHLAEKFRRAAHKHTRVLRVNMSSVIIRQLYLLSTEEPYSKGRLFSWKLRREGGEKKNGPGWDHLRNDIMSKVRNETHFHGFGWRSACRVIVIRRRISHNSCW